MISQFFACLSIIGTWQYAGFQFDGKYFPNPNPNLVLYFVFHQDQNSDLVYYRKNETGFCERRAEYFLKSSELYEKVNWINPKNRADCSSDVDMQLGREARTQLVCSDGLLGFVLNLNGKEFIYLLEKRTNRPHR